MTAGVHWRLALIAGAAAVLLAPYGIERARESTPLPQETGQPALLIQSPAEGSVIAGNVVDIVLETHALSRNARFAALVDQSPPDAGSRIAIAHGVVDSPFASFSVGGMSPGRHTIVVVAVDGSGVRIGDLLATVNVQTLGPSLVAKAPATSVEGEPWVIDVTVIGIAVEEGGTHLHFLIDSQLPPPGVPISIDAENIVHTAESSVPLIGLAAGVHHVWVVAGDTDHRPLVPYAADRVSVRIGS